RKGVVAAVAAGELLVAVLLAERDDPRRGEHEERHAAGVDGGPGHDPARRARIEHAELATVDTVSFAHGADCADGISCQQVEVAGVAGAALTARLTHAALVERGDRESAGYDRQRIDHGA